jgi:cyclin B
MGETFFLTVRLIDQYLSVEKIARNRLQLLGITALWVAAKYQETYQVPKIDNLVYICDSAYSPADILAMEGSILLAVRFGLLVESPLNFF